MSNAVLFRATTSPRTADEDHEWQSQAACQGTNDQRLFGSREDQRAFAAEVCSGCPVRARCLAEGLANTTHEDVGVWGGTTDDQRALMRKNRTRNRRSETAVQREERLHAAAVARGIKAARAMTRRAS